MSQTDFAIKIFYQTGLVTYLLDMSTSDPRDPERKEYDVDDWDLFSHSLSLKLEYYRCVEFNLKWTRHMSPRCSSRLSKASKTRVQNRPKPSQDVAPGEPRRQTRRTRLRNADGCKAEADDEKDLLDLIDSSGEDAVEIVDNGLDVSDEDLASDCCSVVSGPSMVRHAPSKTPKSSHGLCSACRELYQKAKRTKAPIKNKLLDNDPKSLT
ncbi:uncharacterized protein LOC106517932 [Austrofundulus limnaeus]|uniref:Uncharacterized protein LOC106517932 n=1 Tax=Austrofundulus limnaeus TaxID=52670 RepID=A0A2I4B9K6_AUSLI|nr:PREDICTED: uncharacterized protein LOC106517932 [Austrofundulus limnaeus]